MENTTLYDKAKAKGYPESLCRFLHAKEMERKLYENDSRSLLFVGMEFLYGAIDRDMSEASLIKLALSDVGPWGLPDIVLPDTDMTMFCIQCCIYNGAKKYKKLLRADKTFDYERAFAQLKEKYRNMSF